MSDEFIDDFTDARLIEAGANNLVTSIDTDGRITSLAESTRLDASLDNCTI